VRAIGAFPLESGRVPPARSPIILCLLLAGFARVASADPASTRPAEGLETFVKEQREALQQVLADAPPAPARPIDSLVRFDVVRGRLAVELLDANIPEAQSFPIAGKAETAFFLSVNRLSVQPPITMFRAHLMRYDAATQRSIDVDVMPAPSVVNLTVTIQTPAITTTIQLIDQSERGFGGDIEPAVTKLYVQRRQENGDLLADGSDGADFVLPSFRELIDQHHEEAVALLGEGFSAMRAMHVLSGVGTAEVSAIFEADRPIDAAARRELDAIVEDVRHGGSEAVAIARPRLRKLGPAAAAALANMSRVGWTADLAVNMDALTAGLLPAANARAASLLLSPGRIVDLLYSPDAGIRRDALAHLERLLDQKIAIDLAADPYTIAAEIEALRVGHAPATRPTR
jgi:hypothetical protein